MRRWFSSRFCFAFLVATALMLPATSLAAQTPTPNGPGVVLTRSTGKLSSRLQALAQSATLRAASAEVQARALSLPASGPGSLLKDAQGRLLVYVSTDDLSAANLNAIQQAGARIEHVSDPYKVVTVFVPVANLNALAGLATVKAIREELQPVVQGTGLAPQLRQHSMPAACSPVISEGDTQLKANTARSTYGVDGTGVKVGVLSDSFNKNPSAVTHWTNDILNGDLPGVGNPCGRLTGVSVLSETVYSTGSDEGRAMAQIIHDLAPGAQIGFASAFNGIYEFADNIRALRTWGANVIVDDVYYYMEPLFQDGPVAVAIRDVVNSGAMYFTSGGNSNQILGGKNIASYESGAYRSASCLSPSGLPGYVTNCHNFNTAGTTSYDQITLGAFGSIDVDLQWNEPWNGVATDFDLYLLDNSGNVVAESIDDNSNTEMPYEYLRYDNPFGSSQNYRIVITRFAGSASPRLKFFFSQYSYLLSSVQFNTTSGNDTVGPTLSGHSASKYANSVAAVPYSSNTTPEYFSSRGPAAHYWGPAVGITPAPAIAKETLQQPDFTATDGGRNSFFGGPYSGVYRFYGTSAAAPHAAAVAALVLQKAKSMGLVLNQYSMRNILKATATSMSGGNLNSVGAGMVNALKAVGIIQHAVYVPVILK